MILVNDEERPELVGKTVHERPHEMDPRMPMVAVKIDGTHVPRRTWHERAIADGDVIWVVYFISGG